MIRKGFFVILLLIFGAGLAVAEPSVGNASIAMGVENRQPFEPSTVFASDVGQVYCFSRMIDAEPAIKHMWYYGDKLMAEVNLDIKSKSYRTYSSKKIYPGWVGQWHVDIVSSDGEVLKSLVFDIQ